MPNKAKHAPRIPSSSNKTRPCVPELNVAENAN